MEDSVNSNIIKLQCANGKGMTLEYAQVYNSPGEGAIYIPEVRTGVSVFREGKPSEHLMNQPSFDSSFSLYVNADKTMILEISGYTANLTEKGFVTYRDCEEK